MTESGYLSPGDSLLSCGKGYDQSKIEARENFMTEANNLVPKSLDRAL